MRKIWWFIFIAISLSSCASTPNQYYSPLFITKGTAEGIMLVAKQLNSRGELSLSRFKKLKTVYTDTLSAKDEIMNATRDSIDSGIEPPTSSSYKKAYRNYVKSMEELYFLSVHYGILTIKKEGDR